MVSASLVKELRELTGAGMMDCKRALEETDGDVEAARKLLREKGIASAGKRAERETTEGRVLARVEDGTGTMVAVGSESEPVAQNDEFLSFAEQVLNTVECDGPDAVSGLDHERVELIGKIGENIVVRGASRIAADEGEVVTAYIHPPAQKIGVLLRAASSPEFARLLAMHIAFADPQYVDRESVPLEDVEAERAIYEKLPEVAEKPENIRPKIVDGMLKKRFFSELVLTDQVWIHDDSKSVGQALDEEGAQVREFARYALGE